MENTRAILDFPVAKTASQILALLKTTPQKVADSAPYRAIMVFLIWVGAYRFFSLNYMAETVHCISNKIKEAVFVHGMGWTAQCFQFHPYTWENLTRFYVFSSLVKEITSQILPFA